MFTVQFNLSMLENFHSKILEEVINKETIQACPSPHWKASTVVHLHV